MPYIIENNYILDAEYRSLVAASIDNTFFLIHQNGDYGPILNETGGQELDTENSRDKDGEIDEFYWPSSNGPLTLEEIRYFTANDYYFNDYDIDENEQENITFPSLRFILHVFLGEEKDDFFEKLAQLHSKFGRYYKMYKEKLREHPQRHEIWSQYWIGFTASEENRIYMSKNSDGTIKLEYIDEWCSEGDSEADYYLIDQSNIFNEIEIATIEQIEGKTEFLSGLINLLAGPSKSDIANKIDLKEISFNFQELADKVNAVEPLWQVSAQELEAVLSELKHV